jgi:hypothetical protein
MVYLLNPVIGAASKPIPRMQTGIQTHLTILNGQKLLVSDAMMEATFGCMLVVDPAQISLQKPNGCGHKTTKIITEFFAATLQFPNRRYVQSKHQHYFE